MIECIVKGTDLRFDLPTHEGEVTLGMFLDFLNAPDESAMLSALSGVPAERFRESTEPALSIAVSRVISFIGKIDLSTVSVPTVLYIGERAIKPPKQLSGETTFGQKLMIDGVLLDMNNNEIAPTHENMAMVILSVYLYPLLTGESITDIAQIEIVRDQVRSIPYLQALKLADFFLSSILTLHDSGKVSYRPKPAKVKNSRWRHLLIRWFPAWIGFRNISSYSE